MLRISYFIILVLSLSFTVAKSQNVNPKDALIAKFETPDHRINDVAFSSDGKMVAAAYGFYDDGGVTIWNIANKKTVAILLERESKRGGIKKIAFSNNGKLFAAADDNGKVWLWKVGDWKNNKKIIVNKGDSNGLNFSLDSTKLAFSSDVNALIYDFSTDKIDVIAVGKESENEFDGISFSPDGKSVVVSGNKGTQIWDITSKKIVKKWNNSEYNFFGGLSPKGNYFISGGGAIYGDKSVKIRHFPDGKLIKELTDFRNGVFTFAISNTEKYLALAGGDYGGEGSFGLWSLEDFKELGFGTFGDFPVKGLAFNFDDSVVAIGSENGFVLLYDVNRFRGKQVESQKEALCGEIQTENAKTFIRPLSKIPGIMSQDFVFPWRLEIENPNSIQNAIGLPVVLKNWFIVSSSADDKAKIDDYKTILNKEDDSKNYIVFGVGENPGYGYVIKVFSNGNFVSANRDGKCLSYGNLSQLKTDYQTVNKRLLDEDFLSIPKEPLTIGADHFRTEFIEIVTNGVSEIRTDADSFELLMKEKGKTKKREAFSKISAKEQGFVDSLLKSGFK
jgi:WD40 repeat protein